MSYDPQFPRFNKHLLTHSCDERLLSTDLPLFRILSLLTPLTGIVLSPIVQPNTKHKQKPYIYI